MDGIEPSSASTAADQVDGSETFDRLFDQHYPRLLAFAARRVDNAADAEDVLAETFAVVWRRRDAVPAQPLPWLYGVARRVIANQRRGRDRARRLTSKLAAQRPDQGEDAAGAFERRSLIREALTSLGDTDREALILVAWEGLEAREAAAALDCSAVAFRVRLHRARRRFRAALLAAGAELPQPLNAEPATTEECR